MPHFDNVYMLPKCYFVLVLTRSSKRRKFVDGADCTRTELEAAAAADVAVTGNDAGIVCLAQWKYSLLVHA